MLEDASWNIIQPNSITPSLSLILPDLGYVVSGTPATGDQGTDLVAERDGRKIIIQAKGTMAP
jgi:HJR/Mrr/RecB family endonuclease